MTKRSSEVSINSSPEKEIFKEEALRREAHIPS